MTKFHIFNTIFLCIFFPLSLTAQNFAKRYLDKMLNDTTDVSKAQLITYPTLAFAPETSWEIGLSTLYIYHAKQDTLNRLSEFNAFTFFTLQNQYGLWFDHALYTDKNKWFFLGKLRFQSFPLFYHGIGINSPADYVARIDAGQILIKERVLRQIRNNIFVGLTFDLQRFANVDFVPAIPEEPNFENPLGYEGSTSIGLGIGLVHDDRHNVLNVRKGLFSELAIQQYSPIWGSTFGFTSILSDSRIYRQVGKNNVIAAQVLGQFNFGEVPFNQLAQMGGESIMRGYYFGRYRDNHQLASQVEFRFLPLPLQFTNRLGFAIFGGAATVFPDFISLQNPSFVFAGGAGLRFLLFPKKDIWTRLDCAVTSEDVGFYLFIGEAF